MRTIQRTERVKFASRQREIKERGCLTSLRQPFFIRIAIRELFRICNSQRVKKNLLDSSNRVDREFQRNAMILNNRLSFGLNRCRRKLRCNRRQRCELLGVGDDGLETLVRLRSVGAACLLCDFRQQAVGIGLVSILVGTVGTSGELRFGNDFSHMR